MSLNFLTYSLFKSHNLTVSHKFYTVSLYLLFVLCVDLCLTCVNVSVTNADQNFKTTNILNEGFGF